MERPFPPSPRRLTLARQAGLHAASPVLVGAAAAAAALLAAVGVAASVRDRLASWISVACRGANAPDVVDAPDVQLRDAVGAASAPDVQLREAVGAVLALAAPILVAAALAALAAHLVQTRALWLPRRRIPQAPALPRSGARRTAFDLAAAAAIGATAVGWLWLVAPRLAALPLDPLAAVAVAASAVAALAIAWFAVGALDALLRYAELAYALRMTSAERREDARLAGTDPRWRRHRASVARDPAPSSAVAAATVLLLGDDVAVAIAWDPMHRPVPARVAVGRRARATQLLALARRYAIPIHREAALAARLVDADGPVPEAHWPRLAEIIAAISSGRRRDP